MRDSCDLQKELEKSQGETELSKMLNFVRTTPTVKIEGDRLCFDGSPQALPGETP